MQSLQTTTNTSNVHLESVLMSMNGITGKQERRDAFAEAMRKLGFSVYTSEEVGSRCAMCENRATREQLLYIFDPAGERIIRSSLPRECTNDYWRWHGC